MKLFKRILLLIMALLVCLVLIISLNDYKKTEPILYHNGQIITMDEGRPNASAMLVSEGKIINIGTDEDLRNNIDKKITQVDLKGQVVMPGFIDPHTHFASSIFLSQMHDLSGFTHDTSEEVWKAFEAAVAKTTQGEWIMCRGIDPVLIPDIEIPTKQKLDQLAPENPVFIISQSMHSFWANSVAFEKAGITRDTPDPSEHSYYGRDADGHLSGLIAEQDALQPFLAAFDKELNKTSMISQAGQDVMTAYASNGNTTIASTGLAINDGKPFLLFEHLSGEHGNWIGKAMAFFGAFPKRQANPRHLMYMRHDRSALLPEERTQNDFYGFLGIKHWYDGSPYIGSMYLDSIYLNNEFTKTKLDIPANHKGHALIDSLEFLDFLDRYQTDGWQIAIHTQGDAAIRETLDAYQIISDGHQNFKDGRHRIEHCLLLQKNDISRMKVLNITPSIHINHLLYYGDILRDEMLGTHRAEQILPLKSIADQGIKFSLHADQPMFESDPWRLIQTAVERQTRNGNIIGEDQKIDLHTAIKSLTTYAAWQLHMDDKIGSLSKGKYADFIILDRNPYKVATEQIADIEVLETYVAGNRVKF